MKRKSSTGNEARKSQGDSLYTLEVSILSGPMTEEFVKQNHVVSRTIQIMGGQTLQHLHRAIFNALDRDDEHMYEFQFGKKPHDPKGKRYALPEALDMESETLFFEKHEPSGNLTRTTIGSLGLKTRQTFLYWFDFGDDWWHQIKVISIDEEAPKGKYPKVIKRIGQSPPQYIDWEEEDEED